MVPQDILGYNVELKGPGGVTLDGFYALMGCSTPLISGDRGCNTSTTYVHINVEVWTEGYRSDWMSIQSEYANIAPKNLGNIGYSGISAHYVPSAVQEHFGFKSVLSTIVHQVLAFIDAWIC